MAGTCGRGDRWIHAVDGWRFRGVPRVVGLDGGTPFRYSAAEDEPKTGVLEASPEPEESADDPEPAEGSGGRLSRWLRRNR